jgi:flagellar hook protein FlgE
MTLATGALEASNVDLAKEFARLVIAQRAFQANSRVVTTGDTLLQELVNLVR